MLYVVVALKSEAQAFVDKYKLNKTKYLITSSVLCQVNDNLDRLSGGSATDKKLYGSILFP